MAALPTVLYCLHHERRRKTYVGVTNNLKRRLRQHNGDIRGGARATRGPGQWRVLFVLSGFPTRRAALQFEWRLHRRRPVVPAGLPPNPFPTKQPAGRRAWALTCALRMERVTSEAPANATMALRVAWHRMSPLYTRVEWLLAPGVVSPLGA